MASGGFVFDISRVDALTIVFRSSKIGFEFDLVVVGRSAWLLVCFFRPADLFPDG